MTVKITWQRILFIHGIIAFIVCGSIFDIVTDREHWPFSQYPMYSGIERRHFKRTRLFGVTQEGEISIAPNRCFGPFDEPRLVTAFRRMKKRPNNHQLSNKAIRSCLDRYEALRFSGIHNGPPLQGLRFYEIGLDLDVWARNKHQPYSRKLLYEVKVVDKKV
jgi:hypothetical protein